MKKNPPARKGLSKKVRFEIFKRDNFNCQYCGRTPPNVTLEVDHIMPVSDGGDSDEDNLVTSCFDCNRGKAATPVELLPATIKTRQDLLKEQEKGLAKVMGLDYLVETISEDASKVCSGCGELPVFKGVPYRVLDEVLYIYETSKGDELPRRLREAGIDKEISSRILKRVNYVDHKNDVFPDYCKINIPNGD